MAWQLNARPHGFTHYTPTFYFFFAWCSWDLCACLCLPPPSPCLCPFLPCCFLSFLFAPFFALAFAPLPYFFQSTSFSFFFLPPLNFRRMRLIAYRSMAAFRLRRRYSTH